MTSDETRNLAMPGAQPTAPAPMDARRLMELITDVFDCAECHHDYTCAPHLKAFEEAFAPAPRSVTMSFSASPEYPDDDPERTLDLVLIAGIEQRFGEEIETNRWRDVVQSWTPQQREQVERYCAAVHLRASDNDDVVVPPRPAILDTLRPPVPQSRTSPGPVSLLPGPGRE